MRLLALAGCMQSLALHPSTVWQTGAISTYIASRLQLNVSVWHCSTLCGNGGKSRRVTAPLPHLHVSVSLLLLCRSCLTQQVLCVACVFVFVLSVELSLYVILLGLSGLMCMPVSYERVVCAEYTQYGRSTDCQSQAGPTLRPSCAKRKRHAESPPDTCRVVKCG